IHRAEGSVVETVARLTRLTPDHPAVIRADGAVEAGFAEGGENSAHVDVAMIGRMRGLFERAHAGSLDVAAVRKMNPASASDDANDVDEIVCGVGCQPAGAETNPVNA